MRIAWREKKVYRHLFIVTFYHFVGLFGVINVFLMEYSALTNPLARPFNYFVHLLELFFTALLAPSLWISLSACRRPRISRTRERENSNKMLTRVEEHRKNIAKHRREIWEKLIKLLFEMDKQIFKWNRCSGNSVGGYLVASKRTNSNMVE